MPIDPRIPLGVNPVQIASPLQSYTEMRSMLDAEKLRQAQLARADQEAQLTKMQIQQVNRQLQQEDISLTEQKVVQDAMGSAGGDTDKFLASIRGRVRPQTELELQKSVLSIRKELSGLDAAKMEQMNKKLQGLSEAAFGVYGLPPEQRAASWPQARKSAILSGFAEEDKIPSEYPGDQWLSTHINVFDMLKFEQSRYAAKAAEQEIRLGKARAGIAERELATMESTRPEDYYAYIDQLFPPKDPKLADLNREARASVKFNLDKGDVKAANEAIKAVRDKALTLESSEILASVRAGITGSTGLEQGDVITSKPAPDQFNKIHPKTGLTFGAMYAGGVRYALTGTLPSMGMGSRPQVTNARMAIQNTAAALADSAGTDLPTLQAEYKANSAALTKLVPLYNITAAFVDTATHNIELARQQSPRVVRSASPFINRYINWANGETLVGNPELTRFETYIYTAAREYAKVTSGAAMSAAGLTDTAAREAGKLMNAAQTPTAFQAATEAMQKDMGNVISAQEGQIDKISGVIGSFLKVARGGEPGTTGAGVAVPPVGGTVRLQAPDGTIREVPAADADHYIKLGAKRIP